MGLLCARPLCGRSGGGGVTGEAENKLYSLALRCWHELPAKRPPFRQLNDELLVLSKVLVSSRAGAAGGGSWAGRRGGGWAP